MREIARAVSMLRALIENRCDDSLDEVIKQANESFELIEAELKEKTEQIRELRAEVDALKSTIASICKALRGGGTDGKETTREGGPGDRADADGAKTEA